MQFFFNFSHPFPGNGIVRYPKCKRDMKYLQRLSMDTFEDHSEGKSDSILFVRDKAIVVESMESGM